MNQRKLQTSVDAAVSAFDSREAASESAVGDLSRKMDADGFTLVTHGAKPRAPLTSLEMMPTAEGGTGAAAGEGESAKRRKKGPISKTDFYKFQRTEDKLGKLAALKTRFNEDRERVRKLKSARTFKPF